MPGASEILIVQLLTLGIFVLYPLIDIANNQFKGSNKIIWFFYGVTVVISITSAYGQTNKYVY